MVFKKKFFLSFFLTATAVCFLAGIGFLVKNVYAAYSGNCSGYAWSTKAGWVSFETTASYGAQVTDTYLDGYAWGEKTGYISLKRDSGTPDYSVTVTISGSTGNLSGYAWSEKGGYIKFAAAGSTYANTSASDYGVTVNGSTGVFSGYAWSEKLGWIKFAGSCSSGTTGACSGGVYGVITSWRVSVAGSSDGYLVSNIFDSGASGGASINYIMWQGTQPTGTSVKFQLASSDSTDGPWSYEGGDGTDTSYYTPSGPGSQVLVRQEYHVNKRYFRYKIFLYADEGETQTPTVTDVILGFSR